MDRPRLDAGRISLLIASLNLAVPPVAGLLAEFAAEVASNSEAAFWGWACCLAFGVMASLTLGVAWLFAILLASGRRWSYAGQVSAGLLLNCASVCWALSAFRLK